MKHIVYTGPHAGGVVLGDTGQECERGKAIEVSDEMAASLLETGDWRDAEAKRTTKKES